MLRQLNQLNFEFYQTFSAEFSQTRQRLQPGVQRLLERMDPQANILDMGCGNGELARQLRQQGHPGAYFGFDQSEQLIEIARENAAGERIEFEVIDLTNPSWSEHPALKAYREVADRLDLLLAFSVLHHIPGNEARLQIGKETHQLCHDESRWMVSTWNFLESSKWRGRICDWAEIGLDSDDVEPGDYLLDWRRGGRGLRYVHYFTSDELAKLADQSGFQVLEEFLSDGEGGQLGRYQVWAPVI